MRGETEREKSYKPYTQPGAFPTNRTAGFVRRIVNGTGIMSSLTVLADFLPQIICDKLSFLPFQNNLIVFDTSVQ